NAQAGHSWTTWRADLATMVFDVDGKISSLAPLRRQDINLLLSGSFGLKGPLTNPAVHADIVIDKGRIELANLPGGSITELEIYQPEQEKKEQESASFGTIDAHVRIPNQLFIQGYGLDCEWKGDVYAKGPLTRPSVTGSLEAVRGTLDIISKNFKLVEGKILFDGGWPVSPLLNIDMEYQAASVTADIVIGGTATNPKLNLTSKPVLPRDEILAQVLFGQSSGSLSHVQALQLASAVATLAGFGGTDVLGKTRKALGIDVLKLNSDNDGKDSDVSRTTLEMGTYVHDNVYVGMEQGIGKSNDTGAVVEIELLPGVGVQAKTFSTKSEVGIKWKKNY
ncbi:MAG: translocation/assembly module TamB, partial [Mailhella sp.]|nr:translocation/assembly module TamB [Mailhella sp.]